RTINIAPKYKEIKIAHILRLYNYVYSYRDTEDDALLDINKSNQSQNIVKSFLRNLKENIFLGILQDYLSLRQDTRFLKGNIDYITTYKNMLKMKRNAVRTDVYTLSPNLDINRLIVGALHLISQSGKYAMQATDLLSYFNNVDPITENASEYLHTIYFTSK